MVAYTTISNATLATVLTELATRVVGKERIVQIFHDGTNYHAVYVVN